MAAPHVPQLPGLIIEKCPQEDRGRGLFATRAFKAGEVLFTESPLVSMQTLPNRQDVPICANCCAFVGTKEQNIDLLCRRTARANMQPSTWSLPASFPDPKASKPVAMCPQACGETFCSDACAFHALTKGAHGLLCVGPLPEDHPLLQFKVHAMQTNEIFLMAASVIASIIADVNNGASLQAASAPYTWFVRGPWWEVAQPDDDEEDEREIAKWRAGLKEQAKESITLLRAALGDRPGFEPLFTLEAFGDIIGMFELNNVGILQPSPVNEWFVHADRIGGDIRESALASLRPIAETIKAVKLAEDPDDCEDCDDEGEDGCETQSELAQLANTSFPPLDGTGLFTYVCSMNHSCLPLATTTYMNDPNNGRLLAKVTALVDIPAGVEITHSYIERELDEEDRLDVDERRARLKNYGFYCQCERCMAESSAPESSQ